MGDFVSYYRRFTGISGELQNFVLIFETCHLRSLNSNYLLGKQSFSLLYTSINVLSGHYTRYLLHRKFPFLILY